MTTMEIVLLICGAAIFIISFFVPDRKGTGVVQVPDQEEVSRISEEQMTALREKMYQMADEVYGYVREKTENSLDRISNEKMMALNEYSESVLSDIEKNRQEVVFLHDMLNSSSVDLKNTVREAQQTGADLRETVKNADAKEVKRREKKKEDAAVSEEPAAGQMSAIERLAMDKAGQNKTKQASKGKIPVKSVPVAVPAEPALAKSAHDIDLALDEGRTPGRNKNEMILKLHRQGKSNVEVARELGLGMGEVKLVIDLFEGPKGGAK